jgi:Putative zinc-binding metallo-peptidase
VHFLTEMTVFGVGTWLAVLRSMVPASRSADAPFTEAHPRVDSEARERLLRSQIGELGLKIEGSRLEPLVAELHRELEAAGIDLKPRVYLSDEWGCPDGVPLIGVPFYLADPRLSSLQKEILENIEAESDAEILAYLRHEAGHAFNYAYRLHENEEWHQIFGPYSRPYLDDYAPNPFSRSFVRHIPGWYAQKHPDEDFAETFAVWLTPGVDWRREYQGWGCLAKLEYVERTVQRVGRTPPLVPADYDEALDLAQPLARYFERFGYARQELPAYFDADLKRLFRARSGAADTQPAGQFIREQRRELTLAIGYWTGLGDFVIRSLLEHLSERADQLELGLPQRERERCVCELATYATALCMNRLYKGDFVVK